MDIIEDWKSICRDCSPDVPIVLHSNEIGPLVFRPVPETLSTLFSYPSLSPFPRYPPPQLSLSRFLETTTYPDFPILSSSCSSIAASFQSTSEDNSIDLRHNHLVALDCPYGRVMIFFPTGCNFDQVGLAILSNRNSELTVNSDPRGEPLLSQKKFGHRIVQLCASPVKFGREFETNAPQKLINVGYLVACTMYAVHWFRVGIRGVNSDSEMPVLLCLDSKVFPSPVRHACWNQHSPEECLVLLNSGELFIFGLNSEVEFRGSRLNVPWDESGETTKDGWFSCAFSWHRRVLVVANTSAIFLVDFRHGQFDVSCLLKIDDPPKDVIDPDRFITFAKGGPDEFYFAVASQCWLYVCDIRRPLMPVLQWAHHLRDPYYMTVHPSSELKSNVYSSDYSVGFAVILGSFWNCDFSIFFAGPQQSCENFSDQLPDEVKPIYAWGHPSDLSLISNVCSCGTCLLKEELDKERVVDWIQWQEQKDLVLGFFILNRDLASQVSEPDEYGGFTLIRMMSSGKLESQRYLASFHMTSVVDNLHREATTHCSDDLAHFWGEKCIFPRKYDYMELEYLYANWNGTLINTMFKKTDELLAVASGKDHPCVKSHEILCKNLEAFGSNMQNESDIFKDVDMPAMVYEVASMRMWKCLPLNVLERAFSSYDEILEVLLDCKKVSLDFLLVPDQVQLPPFCLRDPSHRSNKWSSCMPHEDGIIGPTIPLPASLALKEIHEKGHEFSPEKELSEECQAVMHVAESIDIEQSDKEDSKDGVWANYFSYRPSFLADPCDATNVKEDRHSVVVAKLSHRDLCPVELRIDAPDPSFKPKELENLQKLKSRFIKWQDKFGPYKDFCAQFIRKK